VPGDPARPVSKIDPHPLSSAAALRGSRWTSDVRIDAWWRWPAAGLLAVLTCSVPPLAPAPGLDNSWQAGLALAQQQGLHFGRDVVFTYGPLGFLTVPRLFVVWSGVAAVVLALLLQLALCRTLLHVLRGVPGPVAFVLAYVVATVAPPTAEAEIGLAIVLSLTLWTLIAADRPAPRWLPGAGGIAAATLLLVKPDTGVFALVLLAIAVGFSAPRRLRPLAELGGSFLVAVVALWLATGNAVGDFVPWLRASAQFALGYTGGMAFIDAGRHREIVDACLLIVVMAALVAHAAAGLPRKRQAALGLVWAIGTFALFKEGFVRLDAHAATFFFAAAVVAATLARGELTRIAGVGAAVVASVWSLTAFGVEPSTLYHYTDRFNGTRAELRLLADGSAREAMRASARATMLANLRIPPAVLRDLRSHTVDVEPAETSAVWTLGLRWRPEPDFQTYAVLTPALDRMNADELRSTRAAERVLRVYPLGGVDGRNPVFDAPAAFLAFVCNYRQTYSNAVLAVFAHATDRCGAPRPLGSTSVRAGQHVLVPKARPGELVYARLQIPRSFSERLRELAWKPKVLPAIVLDGVSFRLVAATASGPLLMRMPASAGFSSRGLNDANVRMFRLANVPSPVTVDFYAVRVG
jgi:hypothetical protein